MSRVKCPWVKFATQITVSDSYRTFLSSWGSLSLIYFISEMLQHKHHVLSLETKEIHPNRIVG